MGTRGLTCVFKDGDYKVAQYGQWDHYPEGQGKTILDFLTNGFDRQLFEKQLDKIVFTNKEDFKRINEELEISDTVWINMEEANRFKTAYPQLDRDMGGHILEYVQNVDADKILLTNSIDFAQDGLFCEYVYVVDLDKNTLEVFHGFQKKDPPEGSRFVGRKAGEKYGAVHLVKSFDLDNLPDEETFFTVLNLACLSDEDLAWELTCLRDGSTNYALVSEMIVNYVEEMVRSKAYTGGSSKNNLSNALDAILDDAITEDEQETVNEICDFVKSTWSDFLTHLKGVTGENI